jgi:hypothetical protein
MAFATSSDVATRLMRTLTTAETTLATYAIAEVTGLIAEALDKDDDWAAALTPVPSTLKSLCVEKAVGLIVNPNNVASHSESLGAFSHSETFPKASDVGIFLSSAEKNRAKRAVYGSNLIEVRTPSAMEEFLEDALGS